MWSCVWIVRLLSIKSSISLWDRVVGAGEVRGPVSLVGPKVHVPDTSDKGNPLMPYNCDPGYSESPPIRTLVVSI